MSNKAPIQPLDGLKTVPDQPRYKEIAKTLGLGKSRGYISRVPTDEKDMRFGSVRCNREMSKRLECMAKKAVTGACDDPHTLRAVHPFPRFHDLTRQECMRYIRCHS